MFRDILKTEVDFSSNLQEFKSSLRPKISYSNQPVGDELHFKNVDLLLSHKISRAAFKTTAFGDTIVPFAISDSALPFDVFAAAFFFVSRYEEYLPFNADEQGNFPVELSLQSRLKLLEIPVIDAWALILKNILLKKYPNLTFGKKSFNFIPLTCMYTGRASSGGLLLAADNLFRKVKAILLKQQVTDHKDNEIYRFLKGLQDKYQLKGLFFYLPSQDPDREAEGQIDLPNSYLQLLKCGISNDYRMGYKNTPGFRAGTCTPFYWYDLQLEKTTHLLVHPVAINDLSLSADKIMRPAYILARWKSMVDTVKLMNGEFYMLWHQDTLINTGKGKSARKLYEEMLRNFLSLPHDV